MRLLPASGSHSADSQEARRRHEPLAAVCRHEQADSVSRWVGTPLSDLGHATAPLPGKGKHSFLLGGRCERGHIGCCCIFKSLFHNRIKNAQDRWCVAACQYLLCAPGWVPPPITCSPRQYRTIVCLVHPLKTASRQTSVDRDTKLEPPFVWRSTRRRRPPEAWIL